MEKPKVDIGRGNSAGIAHPRAAKSAQAPLPPAGRSLALLPRSTAYHEPISISNSSPQIASDDSDSLEEWIWLGPKKFAPQRI
jgi:hypothetical protein